MARFMPRRSALAAGAAFLGMAVSVAAFAHAPKGESLAAKRTDFLKAYAVAQAGKASWRAWAGKLHGYPLYPWLPAAELEHNLHKVTTEEVASYLKRYRELLPAEDLRRHYLHLLAARRDWSDFLALYRPGFGTTLACDALQARIARGQKLDFKRDLATLWRKSALPRACNKVEIWAHHHGLLTPARLWQRIAVAAEDRRSGTIAFLARWLPHDQRVVARRYVEGLRRPRHVVRAALHWPDTGRNREAALLAITELARKDSKRALRDWPPLERHFNFTPTGRGHILRSLALHRAYHFDTAAIAMLGALPALSKTDATRGWRVRVAIAARDWKAALTALDDALKKPSSNREAWQYLRARVLQKLSKPKKARAQFAALAGRSDYWGFRAADRLGRPYVICERERTHSPAETVLGHPRFARAFELFAVGLLHDARRVWDRAIKASDAETREGAADLAYLRGWYSRPIFTYTKGEALAFYRERFPIADRGDVRAAARRSGVDAAWIYATIRAESAWIPDVGSYAGAKGLMQLMPATAHHIARRHHVSANGFRYEPSVNIRLGSDYLGHMAKRFDGRLWLASAAYNAGPHRVNAWLAKRGSLAPDFFIATIPFTQTREYVIRIAAYSVIYDWLLHDKPTALAWRISGPLARRPKRLRKSVVCAPSASASVAAHSRR
jgi:soluble lytic murein transglycosylase